MLMHVSGWVSSPLLCVAAVRVRASWAVRWRPPCCRSARYRFPPLPLLSCSSGLVAAGELSFVGACLCAVGRF